MARFNFTEINLNSKANITDVMNNFKKVETLGITETEVTEKINSAKTELNTNIDNKLKNYTPSANLGKLATTTYSYGTAQPSGGKNGDIYDQYF